MASSQHEPASRPKESWTSEAYQQAAAFTPLLTSRLLALLAPSSPRDAILDLGCGDGVLTERIATLIPQGRLVGLDSSADMIDAARRLRQQQASEAPGHAAAADVTYRVADCADLRAHAAADAADAQWDRVVSNAALHWILSFAPAVTKPSDPPARARRLAFFKTVHAALKPGGAFVFECGGPGNCGEATTAILAATLAYKPDLTPAVARGNLRLWLPDPDEMRSLLEEAGFSVETLETEYRPTKISGGAAEGPKEAQDGLKAWVRLVASGLLMHEDKREDIITLACQLLDQVVRRADGTRWLGYVRLRGLARKLQ